MPSTTTFETGDIVSVEFPYSDLRGSKRRPGLVLSCDDEDLLLARVTTRPPREPGDVALSDWAGAALPRPSTVRLTKLATVDRRLVLLRIGRVSDDDGKRVFRALEDWLTAVGEILGR